MWFTPIKLPRTPALQRDKGLQDKFTWVQGGSNLSNFLETVRCRGTKDYRIISHQFRVVQNLSHLTELQRDKDYRVISHKLRVPQTYRIPQTLWTIANSCQVPPQARFPVWTTVRTGSEQLNHPELMRNYPVILVSSRAQWFKQVRKSWTTPNSWEIIKFLTCSNYSSTQETRTVVELDMSSWQCVTSYAHTHLKLAAHSTAAHSKQHIIAFQNQYHVTSVQGFEEVW